MRLHCTCMRLTCCVLACQAACSNGPCYCRANLQITYVYSMLQLMRWTCCVPVKQFVIFLGFLCTCSHVHLVQSNLDYLYFEYNGIPQIILTLPTQPCIFCYTVNAISHYQLKIFRDYMYVYLGSEIKFTEMNSLII